MVNTNVLKVIGGELMYESYKIWHTGNLTKLSQLQNDTNYITAAPLANYLPLAGGQMTGSLQTKYYNNWSLVFNSINTTSYGVYMGLDIAGTEALGIGTMSTATKIKYKFGQSTIAQGTFTNMTNPDFEIANDHVMSTSYHLLDGNTSLTTYNQRASIMTKDRATPAPLSVSNLLVSTRYSDVDKIQSGGIYSYGIIKTGSYFDGDWYVIDDRDIEYTPDQLPSGQIRTTFHNNGMPVSNWLSGFYVKGWTGNYAAWQLMGSASTATTNKLFYRDGIGSTWNAWKTVAFEDWVTSQITTATRKYLPLTGGTLTGILRANAGVNIPNNVGLRFATTSANDTFLSAMSTLNGVLILGNNWGKMNVNSTTVTFAGTPIATQGIQIGTASDYGWYPYNNRLCAGVSTAKGVNVGNLLVSSAWADSDKVPSYGIYAKGVVQSASYIAANFYRFDDVKWTTDKTPNDYTYRALYLEDAYNLSSPAPSTYANVLSISGRAVHWVQQLWFGSDTKIRVRIGDYNADPTKRKFTAWETLATESFVTSMSGKYLPLTGGTLTGVLTLKAATNLQLHLDTNSGSKAYMRVSRGGVAKSAFGFVDSLGACMYSYNSGYYLFIEESSGKLKFGTATSNAEIARCGSGGFGGRGNDFMFANNEFNFVKTGYNSDVWFNHKSCSGSDASVNNYNMGNAAAGFASVKARSFIVNGGTASQFLKANGTVDSNTYATTSQLGSYVPLSGGTMSGLLRVNAGITMPNSTTIVQEQNASSNYTRAIRFKPGGEFGGEIGSHNTGGAVDGSGAIIIVPYATTVNPYGKTVGLYIAKNELILDGKEVATSTHLSRYLPLSGGTLTGNLRINGTAIHDHFVVNSSYAAETVVSIERSGVKKAAFGYYDGIGAYLYSYPSSKYLFIDDSGVPKIGTSTSSLRLLNTNDLTWNSISGKPSTFTPSTHYHQYFTQWADTRSTVNTPNDYNFKFQIMGIKQVSAYGIGSGTYLQVFGYRGWSDSLGGNAHEFALSDNGRMYKRNGATTSWGAWNTFAYLTDIPTSLKNPYALTFSGGATGTYDGSAAKTITIPSVTKTTVVAALNTAGTNTITQYCDFTAGAGNSGSDIRFKKNVKELHPILRDVLAIDVIRYTWNKDGETTRDTFGVKAQQLISMGGIFKKMVHSRQDKDNTLYVEYDRVGVLALKGLQEMYRVQAKTNRDLKREVSIQKKTNLSLQERVNVLESKLKMMETTMQRLLQKFESE